MKLNTENKNGIFARLKSVLAFLRMFITSFRNGLLLKIVVDHDANTLDMFPNSTKAEAFAKALGLASDNDKEWISAIKTKDLDTRAQNVKTFLRFACLQTEIGKL